MVKGRQSCRLSLSVCLPNPQIVDLKAKWQERRAGMAALLETLIGKEKDVRRLVVYGYARLVGYNEKLELEPDILKDVTVEDGRIFTFHIRKGHRWSDGHPFTSEDFRYFWEDVQNERGTGARRCYPRIAR